MATLYHHSMHAPSRFIRLLGGEFSESFSLAEEQPWLKRKAFVALNPAGTVPVLEEEDGQVVCGAMPIAEFMLETRGPESVNLLPDNPYERAECRRLCEWFLLKCEEEVVRPMVRERVLKPQMPTAAGGGSPDAAKLRIARANMRQHARYLEYLCEHRSWIGGGRLSISDLAAAASVSVADYLGEVEWSTMPATKEWYARMKSRPPFRPLLTERVRGLPPTSHYADPDF